MLPPILSDTIKNVFEIWSRHDVSRWHLTVRFRTLPRIKINSRIGSSSSAPYSSAFEFFINSRISSNIWTIISNFSPGNKSKGSLRRRETVAASTGPLHLAICDSRIWLPKYWARHVSVRHRSRETFRLKRDSIFFSDVKYRAENEKSGHDFSLKSLDELHFRWLKIYYYWDRDESSNTYLDRVIFGHL